MLRPPPERKHFALPVNASTYLYPTNVPKRDYQFEIIASCFLDNTLVALPTGLGKTFIAGTVMLNCKSAGIVVQYSAWTSANRRCCSLSLVSERQDRLSHADKAARHATTRGLPDDVWDPERRCGHDYGGRPGRMERYSGE